MVVPSTEESNTPTNTEVSVVNDSTTATTTTTTTPSTSTTTTTWTSSLIFPNCVLCPKSKTYQEYIQDVCDMDIFQYTASSTNHRWLKSWIIRFNPQVYVVHPDQKEHPFARNTDGWKLVHDIIQLLRQNGNGSFVSNGGKNIRHHHCQREICCSRYRLYRRPKNNNNNNNNATSQTSTTTTVNTTNTTKKTPMMMNKKKKKKHTYTTLPLHKNEKCTCRIVIQVDTNSYYMDCGVGMATHVSHPRSNNIDPTTTKTITKQRTPRNINDATTEEDEDEEEEEKEEDDHDDFPSNSNDHEEEKEEEEEEDNNDHMPWTDTITPPNTFPTTNTAVMGTLFPFTVNHPPHPQPHHHPPQPQQQPPDPLVVVWEHLHSLLYYCNDEYCHHIQQEMMDMITRTQQYIHHHQQQRSGRR